MPDHIDDLITTLRSLSPHRQARLISHFTDIATAVVDFDATGDIGSRSIGFSFSFSRACRTASGPGWLSD